MKKEIILKYNILNKTKIKIFGLAFVKNNKNNCKLKINDKEIELIDNYEFEKINEKNIAEKSIDNKIQNDFLEIKLIIFIDEINCRDMFYDCNDLIYISELNNLNINDISFMFYGCKSLKFLPDISQWKIENIINMNKVFYGCESLLSLPNISKWNTYNVKDMSYMFFKCKSLLNLPDISKWNTNKVKNMSYILYNLT